MSLITNIQITSSSGTVSADIGAEAANVSFETPVVIDGVSCSTLDAVVAALNTKKLNLSLKGAANGIAELDSNGKVPSSQLPSYVDDVIEGYYNETDGKFYKESSYTTEIEGETGKIYISLDTNKTYRWSGSTFIVIAGDLALGETSSTAYRGDRGKTAYDHATDVNKISTATTSGFYKVGATSEGHVSNLTAVTKADITALGIPDADDLGTAALKDSTSTITSGSTDLIEGGAVYTALQGKANSADLGTAASKDVATSGDASTSQVVMGNDSRLTDARNAADVSAWAKAATKPTYTASEVGAIASTLKGASNGVAELDANGKVPSGQLPSYVDDVLEYASQSAFPATGETGKIYIAQDTNKTYRWSGSAYVEISASLALGETSSTAYRGDRGKTAYDHSQLTSGNPHGVTKSDVGLDNVGNFKAVSTVASQGLSDTEKANARANIGAGTGSVTGVKGNSESTYRTGNVNITAANIGLGNVGNFKAVSTVASQGLSSTEQANARANIGVGTAAIKASTSSVTSGSSDLVESGAVYTELAKKLGDFTSVSDVTVDSIIYHTYWKVTPTSSNDVYGVAVHPTNGRLYRVRNNNGVYSVTNYDKDNNTTTGDGIKMKVAKSGTAGTSITSSLAASTTMDNAIGTLLNNDATLNSKINAMTATFDGITLKLSI